MPEIDNLQININANASKANNSINALVKKIDTLNKSLGSINYQSMNNLAQSVNLLSSATANIKNAKVSDFTRLARGLDKLSAVNISSLSQLSTAMSQLGSATGSLGVLNKDITTFSSAIRALGYKSVNQAIKNIPLLGNALRQMMLELSKAPAVSQNVYSMVNALSKLAAVGRGVNTASKGLQNSITKTGTSANKTKTAFKGLASAIGKFYATYFIAIRGLKKIWGSIESTADYIEAYNYFNVAMGKVGADWQHQYAEYGYDNAEAYIESFTDRLNEGLSKLSGLKVDIGEDGQGLLTSTGIKNLGLNIQEITQYASQLASVTNSLGQNGEVSLAVANSFTKLAGDVSSLFNVDYQDVANNLQSGLLGQARALYKFGIDITNATLETYAFELGLSESVKTMTQSEKQQLRILAILDQSRVAWGDLANTINSPSNMLRQFQTNLKEVGMVLGQLFIPILQKVMPIINAVTIAFKNLLVSIASILGIKVDFGSFGQGYSDMSDGLDEVADSYDDASSAAKKFKTVTLGIDELNINSPQDDSAGGGSGVGGGNVDLTDEILAATDEYEKAFQAAYERMQSESQLLVDKMSAMFEPIKKIFQDIKLGDWISLGRDTGNLATGIFNWFSEALESVNWKAIGEAIGDFLLGINFTEILGSAIKLSLNIVDAFADVFEGSFDNAPLETALSAFIGVLAITKSPKIAIATVTWAIGFDIGKKLGEILFPEDATYYAEFKWADFWDTITEDWRSTLSGLGLMIRDMSFYDEFMAIFNLVKNAFIEFGTNLTVDFFTFFDGIFEKIREGKLEITDILNLVPNLFSIAISNISKLLGNLWNKTLVPMFGVRTWEQGMEGIKTAFQNVFKNVCNIVIDLMNRLIEAINDKFDISWDPVVIAGKEIVPGGGAKLFSIPTIPRFEQGGFPEDGWFRASQGEIMGTFDNGQSVVANNMQIVEGISSGVRSAIADVMIPYLNEIATNTKATADKEMSVNIGDREIARANARGSRSLGYVIAT